MIPDKLIVPRMAPTLATERLVLRPIILDDFVGYEKLMASPRSVYMGGPFDQAAAWGLFCHEVALWPLAGHGGLSIELRATGACIGQVGINHGPLFPRENSDGSSMRAMKAMDMLRKPPALCVTGHLMNSA